MHEWALSDGMVRAAQKIRTEQGLKEVVSITVVLGEIQDIAPDIFKEIFDEVKRQHDGFAETKLVLERELAELRCHQCGEVFRLERDKLPHEISENIHFVPETLRVYIQCPVCGSEDFEILKGRGIYMKEIEGLTD
ncbi:MAG: hydrogenase nickel incorporation protein HypA [Acidobacteriota bacterium]|jgi:hydrogenase nickel incorporation protein HypA/HybF|nr:hydrogenase nickel incorporation protein HypA [Acidobacteriota bacterium]